MNNIFGVNSHVSANLRLKNGYTMYDWVMRKRCFPAFWGRTFLGENAITAEEIEYLRKKNCKIALIIRDLTEQQISQHSGVKDAMRVVAAAKTLGVPQNKGIALFVEVKPEWCINHNWMISFARNLANNGYVAGFIGNTDSSINPVFGRQCSHFVQATEFEKQCGAIFCATEPKRETVPSEWSPYCPSALNPDDIHLWECSTTTFDWLMVDNVYARDEKVLECMW